MSATEEKPIASKVGRNSPALKISRTGRDGPFCTACFHRSDSGTNKLVHSGSNATIRG